MSANQPNNSDNQEIDLGQLSKKIGEFFGGISMYIFKWILFFKKNILTIGILFVIGVGLGIYLDKTTKVYDHQIIVTPNFGSTDYLYSKIDLLEAKRKEKDSAFFKSIGINNSKDINKFEIEPVVDVYSFVNNESKSVNNAQNSQNFELVKLLAEDGDINKVIKDKLTSKNYYHHTIKISSDGKISNENTIKPLLNYLNKSDYFQAIQKTYLENVTLKMKENDSTISQINGFLNEFQSNTSGAQNNDKLVYYNENTQLNDVIKTKDGLIYEKGAQRLQLVNLNKIIKDNSEVINIKNNESTNGKMMLVLPFLFIFIFLLITIFREYYKKQMLKLNS